MLSNVGHTIQKMINNTPVAITVNDTTTAVVTNGGNLYQSGLIGGRINHSFREVVSNENIVGQIIDAEATDDSVYILNSSGSVFDYRYNTKECNPIIREVYSPVACGGDKAVKIVSGSSHILILTENNKVFGAGSNEEYQLVPQGACRYDTAVEITITDTNLHDNNHCDAFTGVYNELEKPIIPNCKSQCKKITCVKDSKCDILLGYLNVDTVTINHLCHAGILSIPVFGDLSYVAFLCIDESGCVSASVTYTITRIYIKCGAFIGKLNVKNCNECHIKDLNISSTKEILIFEATESSCHQSNPCSSSGVAPITGTAQVNGKCGSCSIVNIDLPHGFPLPDFAFDSECQTILLEFKHCVTKFNILCSGNFTGLECHHKVDISLDFDLPFTGCEPHKPAREEVELPQPCWANIYAGSNTSVLVDNCNRLYVLGSIHEIRSNKDLLRRSCLEDLLNKTNASISFPADQLNCGPHAIRNDACKCPKCRDKAFKTDLNKFGIHLNFPSDKFDCPDQQMNVCDFLSRLKNCNERVECDPTCEPCDGYIYLNVSGDCGCPQGAPPSAPIGSITLFNKKSICKLVSQGCPDKEKVRVDLNTIVEFDLNKYCIDTTDVALDKIVKLEFCNVDGPNVNVYIDIDQPGGIKFMADGKKCNVEFTVSASNSNHQFLLNFGSILDSIELTNLKHALSLDAYYPCPKYKNPFDTKITNTYLKGGDRVKFILGNPKNIRQAITPDIPTVFRLNRRVLDVGVGNNNLTVLVGGLACPNDVFVIGRNCNGELGIGNNETIVCWKQINRCIFDCQITQVFSGKEVTFYVSQSNRVYASGQWKCFVNSNTPTLVKSICQSWKIKQMAISESHIVLLGSDGCIFGLGDNSLGELGLCHLECVTKPKPLVFFYKLNNGVAKQLRDGLSHPVEYNHNKGHKQGYPGCGPQGPCGPVPPVGPCGPTGPYPYGPYGNPQGPYDCEGPCDYSSYPKFPKHYRGSGKKYSPNARLHPAKYNKY